MKNIFHVLHVALLVSTMGLHVSLSCLAYEVIRFLREPKVNMAIVLDEGRRDD